MTSFQLPEFVDPRTGIVTDVESYASVPEWPHQFHMCAAHVANTNTTGEWPADRMSTGMGFGDPRSVAYGALGEAIERYCGNFVPSGLPSAPFSRFADRGIRALDPETLLLYSHKQYESPDFPFVPFTRDLPVRWVRGEELSTGEPIHVPASIVYANFYATRYHNEPWVNATVYAGIAAGPSLRAAQAAAMQEIIERDAVEIWWRSGGRPIALPDAEARATAALLTSETNQFDFALLGIPNHFGVPVVSAVLYDPEFDVIAVGTAARPTCHEAIGKAVAEAVSLRSYSKGLLTAQGGAWQAVELGLFGASRLAPFREDRAYAESFAPDFSDMHDLCCNSQYYLDPRARASVDFLRHPARTLSEGAFELEREVQAGELFTYYLDALVQGGVEPVAIDLTTPDAALADFFAARVIAPGTYSNASAGSPFLAGSRWLTEPVDLGLSDEACDPTRPIPPLPHT